MISKSNPVERIIRSFGMSNQMLLSELKEIEKIYSLENLVTDLYIEEEKDNIYLQFEAKVRAEANEMARHYRLFYCLEKSIRQMICDVLESNHGSEWWDKDNVIPEPIKIEVQKNVKREKDAAITPRSSDSIDYTTFGQLGEIIKANWELFGSVFASVKAVEKVLNNLNSLRNPIAHCSPLAEDEVLRLHLSVRDWFRLLGDK